MSFTKTGNEFNHWGKKTNGFAYDNNTTTEIKDRHGFREKLQINEWTFSLFLFCFSFSIVVGKLLSNYGEALHWQTEENYKLPSLPAFPRISNFSSISSLSISPRFKFNSDHLVAAGEKFINISQRYEEAVSHAVFEFSRNNWTWMRAALSGFAMMGFTWYIVYKDSSEPGVNPPSPLSLLKKKRGLSRFGMQMNYFVGMLNGILIFVYLSL